MPEVNFSTVERLFEQKATDRLAKETTASGTEVFPASSLTTAGLIAPTTVRSQAIDAMRMRGPYGGSLGGDERVGFVLTSEIWRKEGKAIALHAGPNAVNWSVPMRAGSEATKSGHVRFAQARTKAATGSHGQTSASNTATYFDNPKMSLEFQTGNIMPIPLLLNEVQIPHGLDDFYLFMKLLNQPPLVPDGDDEGKHNYVWIFYTSLQFPNLVLRGYFDEQGVSWDDTADQPTHFTWRCDFTPHEMAPDLWQRDELVEAYQTFMKANVRLY